MKRKSNYSKTKPAEKCFGCISLTEPGHCDKYNMEGACPCTLCVIKTMCSNVCNDYEKWVGSWAGIDP